MHQFDELDDEWRYVTAENREELYRLAGAKTAKEFREEEAVLAKENQERLRLSDQKVQEFLDFPPEPPSPLETYRDVVMRAMVQACIRALYLPSGVDPLSAEERALLSEEISNEPISHPPDPATSAPSTARATGAPMAPNAPTGLVTPPAILANATVHAEPNEPELEVIERPDTERESKRKRFNDCRIEGAKLASINGKYSVVKGLFHGRHRWQKLGAPGENRVIFFSAPLFQWKICERFDDKAPVLAYAPVSDFGHIPPAGFEVKWFVSDGQSHVHDPKVRFTEEEEDPEAKRRKSHVEVKEKSQRELADLHYKQCLEIFRMAKTMKPEDATSAVVMLGRAVSKKNYQINGVYMQRTGKFHGALCYQKLATDSSNKTNNRFLLYSATKQSWRITHKIQDDQSFAYAKVEDRGATSPGDLPQGYLVWKVYQNREVGYVRDDEVYCSRIDLEALMAAVRRAKLALEAKMRAEEEQKTAAEVQAADSRIAMALAAAKGSQQPLPRGSAGAEDSGDEPELVEISQPSADAHVAGLAGPTGARAEDSGDEPEFVQMSQPSQPSHQPQEERVPGPFSPSPEDRKGDVSIDEGDFSKPRSQMQVTRRTRPSPKSQPIVKVVVKRLEDFVPRPRPKAAEVWPKHKACAKMQVRSGFRCRGCFRTAQQCHCGSD